MGQYTSNSQGSDLTRRAAHVGSVALALFVTAGAFKPLIPWFDATLVSGVVVGVAAAFVFISEKTRAPSSRLRPIVVMFMVFGVASMWSGSTPYATEKVAHLFTLTALAAVAPFFLIRSETHYRTFVGALMVVGAATAAAALSSPGALASPDRLAIIGSGPINTARVGLLAALLVLVSSLALRRHVVVAVVSTMVAILLAIATGSRGPLLSFAIAWFAGIAFIAVRPASSVSLSKLKRRTMMTALGLTILVFAFFVPLSMDVAPEYASNRVSQLLALELGTSEGIRLDALQASVRDAIEHPLGTGWGTFSMRASPEVSYSHNLFAEVFSEAGTLAALLLLAFIVRAYRSMDRAPRLQVWVSVSWFATATYVVMNAMVSGDINSNRIVFTVMSIGLVLSLRSRNALPATVGHSQRTSTPPEEISTPDPATFDGGSGLPICSRPRAD